MEFMFCGWFLEDLMGICTREGLRSAVCCLAFRDKGSTLEGRPPTHGARPDSVSDSTSQLICFSVLNGASVVGAW